MADKERELEAAQREVQDLRDQADSLVRAPNSRTLDDPCAGLARLACQPF